jgi:deoxyribonuclease-1
MKKIFLTLIILNSTKVFGHGGGTNRSGLLIGCHNNLKAGGFHCHSKSKHKGKIFKSESEALLFIRNLPKLAKQKQYPKNNRSQKKPTFQIYKSWEKNSGSFSKSKKLLKSIYSNGGQSFYCNEKFDSNFKFTKFERYKPSNKYRNRIHNVEWEHIVPAENFGKSFIEWREGHKSCINKKGKRYKGRICARKANAKFRSMEADLINLVPVIGQVNALRSNYRYAEISGEEKVFGDCDIEIKKRKFEPPKHLKGDVSRAYRYMQKKYGIKIIGKQAQKIFIKFEKKDPVSNEECIRVGLTNIESGIYKDLCRSTKSD